MPIQGALSDTHSNGDTSILATRPKVPVSALSVPLGEKCARQNDVNAHVILPGAHRSARHMRRTFDTCFTLSLIYNLYVLFV